MGALAVAVAGRCPASEWKDVVASALAASAKGELSLLNAGANKGFAVADFLARFHAHGCKHGCPSVREWYGNLTQIKWNAFMPCGFCSDCRLEPPQSPQDVPAVRVHAFELLAGNHKLLELLFERFKVPGTLSSAALSNHSGTAWRPRGTRTGQEDASAS